MPELKLYSSNRCPFCRKVTSFMAVNNISVPIVDPYESAETMFAFKDLTGKTQVPCLIIDGVPMHESDDIIIWMKENFS